MHLNILLAISVIRRRRIVIMPIMVTLIMSSYITMVMIIAIGMTIFYSFMAVWICPRRIHRGWSVIIICVIIVCPTMVGIGTCWVQSWIRCGGMVSFLLIWISTCWIICRISRWRSTFFGFRCRFGFRFRSWIGIRNRNWNRNVYRCMFLITNILVACFGSRMTLLYVNVM